MAKNIFVFCRKLWAQGLSVLIVGFILGSNALPARAAFMVPTQRIWPPDKNTLQIMASTVCQDISIPAYFSPGAVWNKAVASAPAVGIMIVNPDDGVGVAADGSYVSAVSVAQAKGIKIVGYVYTNYGTRDVQAVKKQIDAYKSWYHVDGIFLDESPTDSSLLSYYKDLYAYVHSTLGSSSIVILNPGTVPSEEYMQVGDIVVTFEDSFKAYTSYSSSDWINKYPASRFMHLVYKTSSANLAKALLRSRSFNVGHVYITSDDLPNPWDTLPTYWSQEVSAINQGCGRY